MPRPRRAAAQLGDDERAMRHVGIIACILDDAGASARLRPISLSASGKHGVSPRGRRIVTESGNPPVTSASKAARAAAAAQAPVVQPRFRGVCRAP